MLTDAAVRLAIREARDLKKPIKKFDERGLFLLAKPTGAGWRFKYQHGGKEKLISFGGYPDVSLSRAREKRDAARALVADGIDPSAERKAKVEASKVSNSNTVKMLADEFFEMQTDISPGTLGKHKARFERYIVPFLGRRPIIEVEPAELLKVLRLIENSPGTGPSNRETAKRVRQLCGQIWRYALAARSELKHPVTGMGLFDISRDLKGALKKTEKKHLAGIKDPAQVGALLRAIDGFIGQPVTAFALKLGPLTFVRPGELRRMEWTELDLDGAMWRIPEGKMKMKTEHLVPLSRQAVALLRELHLYTGDGKYCFPGARTAARPMSENTVNAALRRLGYERTEHVGHGWRSTASTLLNEMNIWNADAIEAQLAHLEGNEVRRTYNKAKFLPERVKMMQFWADYLDELRSGKSKVVPIKSKAVA